LPTPDDVRARVRSAYNPAADFYDHNVFWDRYGSRTIERLGLAPGSSVLDLCCGTGASALPAAREVGASGRVVAVDLAADLVRLGREKASRLALSNLDFRVADMLELEFGQQRFDCVVCVFGIFFVPDMAAALAQMMRFLRPGGRLAVTTWGVGLFEPVNTMFWDAVRRARPELHKSFNPWDLVGEPAALARLFAEARLPTPEIVLEPGTHPVPREDDVWALLMGSGYRGTIEQLSAADRNRVQSEVMGQVRTRSVTGVRTDVLYATCTR